METPAPRHFLRTIIADDLREGRVAEVVTRFPPEPNGYLHIGHAKSICLNFGLAELLPTGRCNLRFDDTNPEVESPEYVEAIRRDIQWLGFDWGEHEYFASDYFDQLYEWAEELVQKGLAYVDSRTEEAIRETRGDFHSPGEDSPFRERSVEENLALLRKMKAGELEEGSAVLRAKIDMQSKDLKLRDPLMYRIKKVTHHRTGDGWSIYPMYDWAHGQSDAIEGVTHSVCSLEFVNHRPLYNWFLKALEIPNPPEQIEFGRLNLSFTVLSKRKLLQLVEEGHVAGWDDPRMPTIAGMRRRGFTPEAIRAFADRIGVSKNDGVVDVGHLEYAIREHLNETSFRKMGVLRPLELVITNWPEGKVYEAELDNIPKNDEAGSRKVPFAGRVWIDRGDFMEDAPKKWWRLAPGKEVRLRGAALITVDEVVKDDAGEVVQLRCTWDPESEGGNASDGRKVKGTVHWVSADHAVDAEVRLYDRLFEAEDPSEDLLGSLNPKSLEVLTGCKVEPGVAELEPGSRIQLERTGYFVTDRKDHVPGEKVVLNQTIPLKDSWAKLAKKMGVRK